MSAGRMPVRLRRLAALLLVGAAGTLTVSTWPFVPVLDAQGRGGAAGPAPAAPPAALAAPTGDATRGKVLFEQTFRCYACHGFDGQTGSPRLVPMARPEEAFVTYVRKPATRGMPSFADAAERDLIDVYAHIRSIPVAAPAAAGVPILRSILDRRAKAN